MAAHLRTQIRTVLMTRLIGLATAGNRVFQNRGEMLAVNELPALLVMNDSDQVGARSLGSQAGAHPRAELHTMSYKIRAVVKANAALDDVLDQICKEVEMAVSGDIFMGGLTLDSRLMDTSFELDDQGDTRVGIATMVWEFDTWYLNTTPDVKV